jgi:L-threonylcarbamoyladenylate synthase
MEVLDPTPAGLARVAALLGRGEVAAIPTETVYGLAGVATDERALARIFAAKDRPTFDPLIVHVAAGRATVARLVEDGLLAAGAPGAALADALLAAFAPGPLTLVLPVRAGAVVSGVTAGRETIAVRVPGHPLARALAAAARHGVITATSANRSGSPALTTALAVVRALGSGASLVIDAGPSPGGLASTIIDLTDTQPRLIRAGPIDFARVLESLR